jgi:hypothetical protein
MRALALVAVVAAVAAGCTERNPDYCDAAAEFGYSCSRQRAADAGADKPDMAASDAAHDADASDAADAGDASDVHDAVAEERPSCTPTMCGGAMPVCDVDAGLCKACSATSECAAKADAGAPPICALSGPQKGACVECVADADCGPAKPICDVAAGVCKGCETGAQCKAKSTSTRACVVGSGACVECLGNAECGVLATQPICDTNKCRGCRVDADCPDGPKVCMEDGSCLADADVVYAEAKTTGCPGQGTAAMPFCAAQAAITKAIADTAKKAVVLVGKGPFKPVTVNATGKTLALIARDGAALEPDIDGTSGNPNVGVSLVDGDLLVRGLEIRNGSTAAVDAEGGTLRLHRCLIHDNAESGLLVKKAGFHVENNVFSNNGGGTRANVDLEATTATLKVFRNNTVLSGGTTLAGIACAQAFTIQGSIVFGGAVGVSAVCAAADDCATMCSGHDPKLDATFSLTAASPVACFDKLAAADAPPLDRLGQSRPAGAMSDCGADEKNP